MYFPWQNFGVRSSGQSLPEGSWYCWLPMHALSSSPRDGSWTYSPLTATGLGDGIDVIQANEVWEKIWRRILGESFPLKKKKKDTQENLISLFPLDLAMPSYDIYNCSRCLATKREANLRTRTKTAEVKETRPQIPDTLLLTNQHWCSLISNLLFFKFIF